MTTNYYQYAMYLYIKTKPQVENMIIKIKHSWPFAQKSKII